MLLLPAEPNRNPRPLEMLVRPERQRGPEFPPWLRSLTTAAKVAARTRRNDAQPKQQLLNCDDAKSLLEKQITHPQWEHCAETVADELESFEQGHASPAARMIRRLSGVGY